VVKTPAHIQVRSNPLKQQTLSRIKFALARITYLTKSCVTFQDHLRECDFWGHNGSKSSRKVTSSSKRDYAHSQPEGYYGKMNSLLSLVLVRSLYIIHIHTFMRTLSHSVGGIFLSASQQSR